MSDQTGGNHLVGRTSTGNHFELNSIGAHLGDVDDIAEATERAADAIEAIARQLQRANEWATQVQAARWSEERIGRVLLNAEEFAARSVADAESRAQQFSPENVADRPFASARQVPHPEPSTPAVDGHRRQGDAQPRRQDAPAFARTGAPMPQELGPNDASDEFDVADLSAEDIGAVRSALEGFASTNTELVTAIARLAEALTARGDEVSGTRSGDQRSNG